MGMTPEERRAKDAERKRIARAAQREKRDAERAAAADAVDASKGSKKVGVMGEAVTKAVASMKWTQPSDHAAIELAKAVAADYDYLRLVEPTAASKLAQLGNLVLRALHELGGTPTVRLQHELRSLRAAMKTGDDDGDEEQGEQPTTGATVSQFKRPEKRAR